MIEYHVQIANFLIEILMKEKNIIVTGKGLKYEIFYDFFKRYINSMGLQINLKENLVKFQYKQGELIFLDDNLESLKNLSKKKKYDYFIAIHYYKELDLIYSNLLKNYWHEDVCFIIGNKND
jgi:hypothetical protein